MSKQQIILRHPSSNRRQPLLQPAPPPPPQSSSCTAARPSQQLAEVAGGTAAECAAVCCCCPCGLLNLLVLAVYKIPAGLCRRAIRKNSRRHRKGCQALPPPCRRRSAGGGEENVQNLQIHGLSGGNGVVSAWSNVSFENKTNEVEELEKEMWERFYGAGFWRSPSQREIDQPSFLSTIS